MNRREQQQAMWRLVTKAVAPPPKPSRIAQAIADLVVEKKEPLRYPRKDPRCFIPDCHGTCAWCASAPKNVEWKMPALVEPPR